MKSANGKFSKRFKRVDNFLINDHVFAINSVLRTLKIIVQLLAVYFQSNTLIRPVFSFLEILKLSRVLWSASRHITHIAHVIYKNFFSIKIENFIGKK